MTKGNSADSVQLRRFDPVWGWTGLVCLLLIVALVRTVVLPERPVPLLELNRFCVNINRASLAELMALPNMGPVTAGKIVEYREQNGPFVSVDQLIRVPGIGPETLRSLRPLLQIVPSEDTDDSLAKI